MTYSPFWKLHKSKINKQKLTPNSSLKEKQKKEISESTNEKTRIVSSESNSVNTDDDILML